ncbi:MAG: hypothetical protein SGCHY_000768, partial [Lobulomycetales sp.]
MQLLAVLETTIPAPVFSIVMSRMVSEIKQKQASYFEVFPPAPMNVKIVVAKNGTDVKGEPVKRQGLILRSQGASKDQSIFSEAPMVSALFDHVE